MSRMLSNLPQSAKRPVGRVLVMYSKLSLSTTKSTYITQIYCGDMRMSRRTLFSLFWSLFLVTIIVISFFHSTLLVQADLSGTISDLTSRHPDAGIWVAYKGENSVADMQKPYIKGVMAYAA